MPAIIKMESNDLYRFTLYVTYRSISGVISLLFSLACLVIAAVTINTVNISYTLALFVLGLLFTVINPLTLYLKCKKQVKRTPGFQNSLEYMFDKSGIHVKQGEDQVTYDWNNIYKIVNTKKDIYIYMDPRRALILPKTQLKEEGAQVVGILKEAMPDDLLKKGF